MLRREKVYAESEILKAVDKLRPYGQNQGTAASVLDVFEKMVKGGSFSGWNMEPYDIDFVLNDSIEEMEQDRKDIEENINWYSNSHLRIQMIDKCINILKKRLTSPKK